MSQNKTLREEFYDEFMGDTDGICSKKEVADFFISKMRERIERIIQDAQQYDPDREGYLYEKALNDLLTYLD